MGFLSSKKKSSRTVGEAKPQSNGSSDKPGMNGAAVAGIAQAPSATSSRGEPLVGGAIKSSSTAKSPTDVDGRRESSVYSLPSTHFVPPLFDLPPNPASARAGDAANNAATEVFQDCADDDSEDDSYQWLLGPVAGAFLGNAMLIGAAFLLVVVWNLFEEFREPLLWGIWCSIALRSAKEWLVDALERHLQSRSLLTLSVLPAEILWGILSDFWSSVGLVVHIWTSKMKYKIHQHRDALQKKQEATADGPPPSKAKALLQTAKSFCVWCTECGVLGVKAASELLHQREAAHRALAEAVRPSETALLFRRLLSGCLLYECFRWADALVGLWALLAAAILGFTAASIYAALYVIQGFRGLDPFALSPGLQREAESIKDMSFRICGFAKGAVLRIWNGLGDMTASMDRKIRDSILSGLDNIVAGLLCMALLVGAFLAVVFFSIQIGGEMHGAVKAAMTVEVKMDVGAVNVTHEGIMSYVPDWALEKVEEGQAQAVTLAKEHMPKVVKGVEDKALELVSKYNLTETVSELYIMYATLQRLPCEPEEEHTFAIDSAKANAAQREATEALSLAERQLSAAEEELHMAVTSWTRFLDGTFKKRLQSSAARGNGKCAAAGRGSLDVDLTGALRECKALLTDEDEEEEDSPELPGMDNAKFPGINRTNSSATAASSSSGRIKSERGSSSDDGSPEAEAQAERRVGEADASLKAATGNLEEAQRAFSAADASAALAGKKLNRCYLARATAGDNSGGDDDNGALVSTELLARLQATLQLLLRLQFTEALEELQGAAADIMKRVENRDLTEGYDTDKLKDLAAMGQGLIDPLVHTAKTLAGALFSSLGSSTSALMSGGASIVNTILDAFRASLSFVSFVGLLYFLLSADEDVIDTTLNSLPVAPSSRATIEKSVRTALSGVFEVTIKLALFYGIFTWLTLRMVGVHFVYLPTLAALVLACFPLIPIMVVLVPAILELAFCGAWLRLAVLAAAHLTAGGAADTIAKSVPGHSPWLTGMAIAGGMATFDNSFKGAMLGPLLVAVLLMLQNLLASSFSSSSSSSSSR